MNNEEYESKNQELTEDEVMNLIESQQTLERHIDNVLCKLRMVDKNAPLDCEDCKIHYDHSFIYFEWTEEEGCMGCYDTVHYDYRLPTEYLWEDINTIVATKKEELRVEAERKKQADIDRKAEAASERERKEYEKFLEMKEKYEGDES